MRIVLIHILRSFSSVREKKEKRLSSKDKGIFFSVNTNLSYAPTIKSEDHGDEV